MRDRRVKDGLQTLTLDVIQQILKYLDCDDVVRFQRLNKQIRCIITDNKEFKTRLPVSFRIDYLTDPTIVYDVPELINNIRVTVRTIRGSYRVVTNSSLVAMVDGCEIDRRFFNHVREHLKELQIPSQDPVTFRIFLDWVFSRMEPHTLELKIPLYDYMRRAFEGSLSKFGSGFKIQKLDIEHIEKADREGKWFMWTKRQLTKSTQLELQGKSEYNFDSFPGTVRLNEYIKYYGSVTIRESINNIYAVFYCIVKEWVRQRLTHFNFKILFEDDKAEMSTNQLNFRNKFRTDSQFHVHNVTEPHFQRLHYLPILIDQRKIEFKVNRKSQILIFAVLKEKECASVTMQMAINGRMCY